MGDVSDAFLNYTLVVKKAKQANIPNWLLSRMLLNNVISAGVGLVPVVGDIVLAVSLNFTPTLPISIPHIMTIIVIQG